MYHDEKFIIPTICAAIVFVLISLNKRNKEKKMLIEGIKAEICMQLFQMVITLKSLADKSGGTTPERRTTCVNEDISEHLRMFKNSDCDFLGSIVVEKLEELLDAIDFSGLKIEKSEIVALIGKDIRMSTDSASMESIGELLEGFQKIHNSLSPESET